MQLDELTSAAMDAAASSIGSGTVTMVNLLWFRDRATYETGFADSKPDARSAYYDGYAGAFVTIAAELGVEGLEVMLSGSRQAGLVAGTEDDWDDIVIVRYRSFADFRRIVESRQYRERANPHRVASIANWRLIATAGKA